MELYVLDDQLRRSTVIDNFVSLLWTERFNDVGDITLNIHSTLASRNLLTAGTYLAMNRSNRVMKIDTVEDKQNGDGSKTLVCTGTSLENLLSERVARDTMVGGESAHPKWVITDQPADIVRFIFEKIMIDGVLDLGDKLPFYAAGNLYPTDTLAEPADTVEASLSVQDVLSAVRTVCQTYDIGFRICRNNDDSELFFNVYSGNDRTSGQSVFPAVIFAPVLDNLHNSSYLTSSKQYKNTAYVFSPDDTAKVYESGVDPSVEGFARRVLLVEASDITYPDRAEIPAYTVSSAQEEAVKVAQGLDTTTQFQSDSLAKITKMKRLLGQDLVNINTVLGLVGTLLTAPQIADITAARNTSTAYNPDEDDAIEALLIARGIQELKKYNNITAFDGEIPQTGTYKYDFNYFLGDITEVRNQDGVVNNVRVTEQIFSQDASGEKSYPTLSSRLVITPGVWAAVSNAEQWGLLDDSVHWADYS